MTTNRKFEPEHARTWRPQPHLYQIHTWAWLDALSKQAGRTLQLIDVADIEWDRIKAFGFDLVYLMGVWQRSPAGRHLFRTDAAAFRVFDHALPGWTMDSVIGSPFSIQDYVPDARIGDWHQLDAVREKLHTRGMRLILDFVPNHTGPDHIWIDSHPEYFLQGQETDFQREPNAFHLIESPGAAPHFIARGRDPYFAPWADTAQLDYANPATRTALIETLIQISQHCDGLRCDMAMLVLNEIFSKTWAHLIHGRQLPPDEFWSQAIAALPSDFLWMAEVYWDMEWSLQQLGFNYTYDKRLYDRLERAAPADVRAHLSGDYSYQSRMARFLENHDEPRSVKTFGRARLVGLAALLATLPGLRFFHHGQFEGKTLHLPMPLNAAADELPDIELAQMYEKTLQIAGQPVFHFGEWKMLEIGPDSDTSHEQIIAYRWRLSDEYKLVVINLAGYVAQGRIQLPNELAPTAQYQLRDLLTDAVYLREQNEMQGRGLYVRLNAYGAHIFSVSALQGRNNPVEP